MNNRQEFMITTGFSFEGYRITEYKGIVYGEIVVPNGLLGALTNGTFFTIESLVVARETALRNLEYFAKEKGANGIVGVDIDICDLNGKGLLVSANGTGVVVEPIKTNDVLPLSLKFKNFLYNQTDHIRIGSVTLWDNRDNHYIETEIIPVNAKNIRAVTADISIKTAFNTVLENRNIILFFDPNNTTLKSRITSINYGEYMELVQSISIDIKSYIADDNLFEPDSHELVSFAESIINENGGINPEELLPKLESAQNALEVADICRENIVIDSELEQILENAIKMERVYGNNKDSAIKNIRQYFENLK